MDLQQQAGDNRRMSNEARAANLAHEQVAFSAKFHPLMGDEPLTYDQCYKATLSTLDCAEAARDE